MTECEVKMAGYWPSVFFTMFIDRDGIETHKHAKMNEVNSEPSWPNKLGQ